MSNNRNSSLLSQALLNQNQIQKILDEFNQSGRNVFGKKQLIYVCMTCPFRGDIAAYLQDLSRTLNSMKNIFQDASKASSINYYFFDMFKRCNIDKQNKETVLQEIHRVIIQEIQNNQVMQQVDQNIDFMIDCTTEYKELAQLAILSSFLGQYILENNFENYASKFYEFNTEITNQTTSSSICYNQNTSVQSVYKNSNNTQVSQQNSSNIDQIQQLEYQLVYNNNNNNQLFQQNSQQQNNNSNYYQNSFAQGSQKQQERNYQQQLNFQSQEIPQIKQADYQSQPQNQSNNFNNTYQLQQQNTYEQQYNQNAAELNFNHLKLQPSFSQNMDHHNQQHIQRFQSHGQFQNNNNQQSYSQQQRHSIQGFSQQANQGYQQKQTQNYQNPNQHHNQQNNIQGNQNYYNYFYTNNNSNYGLQQNNFQQQNSITGNNAQTTTQPLQGQMLNSNFNFQQLQNENRNNQMPFNNGNNNQRNFSYQNQQPSQQQNQRLTYFNQIKKRSQRGQLDTSNIEQLKTQFFEYYNGQSSYYSINQLGANLTIQNKLQALSNSYRAMTKVKYEPREIQLISALCFLFKEEDKGRILQINTGEGKSIIVALIAATLAQLNYYVDVFTSNKVLAQRDCEEFQKFYIQLNLKAQYLKENQEIKDKLALYQQNKIVYGEVSQFGGDYLTDQHERKNVRGERKIGFCIVDEVDCMFIDQHGHKTTLAKEIKGLKKLEDFIYEIWVTVSGNYECCDENKIALQGKDGEYLVGNKNEFVKEKIYKLFFENRDFEQGMRKNIPPHLINFAKSQFEIWIQNAFQALSWKRDERYKVENNDIVMIDSDNTGQKYANMKYGKGMHQFLQLKENLQISPMSVQVNFVSHLFMFKLYQSNIVGLTGTLGTDNSVQILEEFYNLDAYEMPPFTPSKLKIFQPQIYHDQQSYNKQIMERLTQLQSQNRPCLLIYQSERQAKLQARKLQRNFKILEYYSDSQQIQQEIDSFCVIVSTNIAGRGTDFKISENMNKNGGLHVILTFLPKNRRVDYQAFGRAARCGQNGSAEMVICSCDDKMMKKINLQNNQDVQEQRDIFDSQQIKFQKSKMQKFYENDQMFWKFSQLLNDRTKGEAGKLQKQQEEEYWGLFLETNNQIKEAEFKNFIQDMEQRLQDNNQSKSSLYLNSQFKRLIQEKKFEESTQFCQQVIQQDQYNIEAQQFLDLINSKQQNYEQVKQGQSRIQNILDELDDYKQVIQQSVVQNQIQNVENQLKESYLKQSSIISQYDHVSLLEQHEKQLENYEDKILHAGSFQKFKEERLITSLLSSICQSNQKILQECIDKQNTCHPQLVSIQELVKSQINNEEKKNEQNEDQKTGQEDQNILKFNQISEKTIQEFQNNNFREVLVLQEKDGSGFFKRFGIILYGAIQVGIGILLIRTPMPSLSFDFISMGIQDIIQGTKSLLNNESVDYQKYFSKKAINMLISVSPKFITNIQCLKPLQKFEQIPRLIQILSDVKDQFMPQIREVAQVATKKSKFLQDAVSIFNQLTSAYPNIIDQSIKLLQNDAPFQSVIIKLAEFIFQNINSNLIKQAFQQIFGYSVSLLQQGFIETGIKEICNIVQSSSRSKNNLQEILKNSVQNIFYVSMKNITEQIYQNVEIEIFFKTIAIQFMQQLKSNKYQLNQIIDLFSCIYHFYESNKNQNQEELIQTILQIVQGQLGTDDENILQMSKDFFIKNFIKKQNQIPANKVTETLYKIINEIQQNLKEFIFGQLQKRINPIESQNMENNGFVKVLQIVGSLIPSNNQNNNQQQNYLQSQILKN
ncbi:hypothetical protein ABPG74_011381 [Tetrahymena malaccensis]